MNFGHFATFSLQKLNDAKLGTVKGSVDFATFTITLPVMKNSCQCDC